MTLSQPTQRASTARVGIPVIPVALIIAIGVIAQFFIWVEADVAWLLTVARRMNDGSVLYSRDLVEFNPPLVMQLSQVAVLVSQWCAIETVLAFRLIVASLSIGSVTLSWSLLRDTLPAENDAQAVAALLVAATLACLPGLMFGQREHLVVLGFVPYLVAAGRAMRGLSAGSARGVLIGILLALAVSIKPHYALAIVLVELAVGLRCGTWRVWFRMETLAGALALVLIQAAAAVQFPGYLSFAVPLALEYYPAYGAAHVRTSYAIYAVAGVATLAIPRLPRGLSAQREVFALAGIGAFGGYLAQGQGWEYQFLPAQSFFAMAIGLALLTPAMAAARRCLATRDGLLNTASTWVCLVSIVIGLASLTAMRTVRINRHERTRLVTNVRDFVERSWPDDRPRTMASLTLSLFPAAPVAELVGADWGSRFSCLWLVPGISEHESAARAGAEAPRNGRAYLESAVVEDFARWQPTLVLAEKDAPRVLDEMLKSPAFQNEWRHYRSLGAVDGVEVFRRDIP